MRKKKAGFWKVPQACTPPKHKHQHTCKPHDRGDEVLSQITSKRPSNLHGLHGKTLCNEPRRKAELAVLSHSKLLVGRLARGRGNEAKYKDTQREIVFRSSSS